MEWIKCSDRLPVQWAIDGVPGKDGHTVLYINNDTGLDRIEFGSYLPTEEAWYERDTYYPIESKYVTHWMPLPQLPKIPGALDEDQQKEFECDHICDQYDESVKGYFCKCGIFKNNKG
jgi:hypothetical protein